MHGIHEISSLINKYFHNAEISNRKKKYQIKRLVMSDNHNEGKVTIRTSDLFFFYKILYKHKSPLYQKRHLTSFEL